MSKDTKTTLIAVVVQLVFIGLIVVIFAYIRKLPQPIVSDKERQDKECWTKYGYDTCQAVRACGGIEKVKSVTNGGFLVGKGFECK